MDMMDYYSKKKGGGGVILEMSCFRNLPKGTGSREFFFVRLVKGSCSLTLAEDHGYWQPWGPPCDVQNLDQKEWKVVNVVWAGKIYGQNPPNKCTLEIEIIEGMIGLAAAESLRGRFFQDMKGEVINRHLCLETET